MLLLINIFTMGTNVVGQALVNKIKLSETGRWQLCLHLLVKEVHFETIGVCDAIGTVSRVLGHSGRKFLYITYYIYPISDDGRSNCKL
jgi:hypothetical protein